MGVTRRTTAATATLVMMSALASASTASAFTPVKRCVSTGGMTGYCVQTTSAPTLHRRAVETVALVNGTNRPLPMSCSFSRTVSAGVSTSGSWSASVKTTIKWVVDVELGGSYSHTSSISTGTATTRSMGGNPVVPAHTTYYCTSGYQYWTVATKTWGYGPGAMPMRYSTTNYPRMVYVQVH